MRIYANWNGNQKYRKEKNMTQEEMASYLGVTAPAVNKWERGGSYPDIMTLAPLARLLGTDVNTLLCFREEMTEKEIMEFCSKLSEVMFRDGLMRELPWRNGRSGNIRDACR